MNLKENKCVACEGGVPKMTAEEISARVGEIPGWQVVENHHLIREFKFKNFKEALVFVNQVGEIAESEGHHPDIELSWGRVKIKLFTHAIDGLFLNDFILAAKINKIFSNS